MVMPEACQLLIANAALAQYHCPSSTAQKKKQYFSCSHGSQLTRCGAALQQHIKGQQPLLHQLAAALQGAKATSNADAAQQLKPAHAPCKTFRSVCGPANAPWSWLEQWLGLHNAAFANDQGAQTTGQTVPCCQ